MYNPDTNLRQASSSSGFDKPLSLSLSVHPSGTATSSHLGFLLSQGQVTMTVFFWVGRALIIKVTQRCMAAHPRIEARLYVNHEEEMPSKLCVATFPDPEAAQGLCRNPGNFTQGKQTYSVADTPSIINSPVLSFPWGNHSTQQTETQPAAWDLLLVPCGKDYKFTKTHTYHWQWEQVDLFDFMNLPERE